LLFPLPSYVEKLLGPVIGEGGFTFFFAFFVFFTVSIFPERGFLLGCLRFFFFLIRTRFAPYGRSPGFLFTFFFLSTWRGSSSALIALIAGPPRSRWMSGGCPSGTLAGWAFFWELPTHQSMVLIFSAKIPSPLSSILCFGDVRCLVLRFLYQQPLSPILGRSPFPPFLLPMHFCNLFVDCSRRAAPILFPLSAVHLRIHNGLPPRFFLPHPVLFLLLPSYVPLTDGAPAVPAVPFLVIFLSCRLW